MSGIIPKEQLAAYQRWQFNDFDAPAEPATPAEVVAPIEPDPEPSVEMVETVDMPRLPTAEEIAQMHDEARQAGYEAGFEEGRKAAEEAARTAFMQVAEQIGTLIHHIEAALGDFDQQVADQLLDLALETARQLGRGSIQADRTYLLPIIREALTLLPLHHAHVNIVLNPADAASVREHMGEFLSQNGTQLLEDPSVTPGGCKVKAGASEIDASIETRWRRVLEAIGAEPSAWLKTP